jgi:ABC-type branched-subunit amino acid transport system ATPase component
MSLELRGVDAGYGSIVVLRGVSFSVPRGRILGVLGRNGMGKSTLIRTVAGLNATRAGSIHYEGSELTREPAHVRARRGITTIVQGRGMFPQLSVRENLEMGRIASGRRHLGDRLEAVFGYFPRLRERLQQAAGTLSGGEQQMLAIGRGLMTNPTLMLLDEPSDGIMPALVQQITGTLAEINRSEGMSIVVVEQNVPMIRALADRCIVLEKGRIVAEGDTAEVVESEAVREHLAL